MSVSELLAALPQAGRPAHAPDPSANGTAAGNASSAANPVGATPPPFRRFLRDLRRRGVDRTGTPNPADPPRRTGLPTTPPSVARDARTPRADERRGPKAPDDAAPNDGPRAGDPPDDPAPRSAAVESQAAVPQASDDADATDVVDGRTADDDEGLEQLVAATDDPQAVGASDATQVSEGDLPPGLRELFARVTEAVQAGAEDDDGPSLPDDEPGAAPGTVPPGLVALWNRWTATGSVSSSPAHACGAPDGCGPGDAPQGPVDADGTDADTATVLDVLPATEAISDDGDTTDEGTPGAGAGTTDPPANLPPVANAAPPPVAPPTSDVEPDPRVKSKSELRTDRTEGVGARDERSHGPGPMKSPIGSGLPTPDLPDVPTPDVAGVAEDVLATVPVPGDAPPADSDATVPRGLTVAAAGPANGSGAAHGARAAEGELTLPPHVDPQRFADRLARFVHEARGGDRTLRVRLEPPDLGALRIEVSLRDGALSARLDVQTEAARRTLVEHLPLLHEALARQGTGLERVDVQREDVGDQGFANDRNSAGRDGFGGFGGFGGTDGGTDGGTSYRPPFAAGASEPEQPTAGPPRTNRPGRDLSGLDIRV